MVRGGRMTRKELLQVAKPILFDTDMVRAILDGRKTVTRRLVKPQQVIGLGCDKCPNNMPQEYIKQKEMLFKPWCDMSDNELISAIYKPPYEPGDILYVRETWTLKEFYDGEALIKFRAGGNIGIDYECEGDTYNKLVKYAHDKWVPSLFMPKEAARIFLKVTDVRVERLQDMDKMDALKEGIDNRLCINLSHALTKFKKLWNSTIKKSDIDLYGWDVNPWVWVIEFERIEVEV